MTPRERLHLADKVALPLDWMTMATVVYGARGSGKSTLGSVVAEELNKAKQRFCAIDLKGDFYGLKSSRDGKSEAIPVVIFGGDHADLPLEEGSGKFVAETIAGLDQSTILDLEHFSKGKQIKFLGEFFAALYDANREPLLMILDEAQRYAPQKPISPDSAVCLGAVEDLVKLGRKHGLGVMLLTQRGSGLNKEVSEICDMLVAFRTPGPLDQGRVRDWLEANVTEENRDAAMEVISGLDTGTAVFASGHPSLKLFGVAHVRQRETFDSSATPKVGQRKAEPKKLATPDLEVLRTRMSAAIERSKADDPKLLRAEIQSLKKQLASASNVKVETKTVEVPILTDKDRKSLDTSCESIDRLLERIGEHANKLGEAATGIRTALSPVQSVAAKPLRTPGRFTDRIVMRGKVDLPPGGIPPGRIERLPASRNGHAPIDGDLPKGERAVLTAIAQYDDGVERDQLSVLTGYKRSTRDAYIARLSERGFIAPVGSSIMATPEGVEALGAGFEPLPTGDALRAHWLERLPLGEARILEVLIRSHPDALTGEALSDSTEFKRSTRDAYIARLTARRLVERVGRGEVRASNTLFDGATR